jgi:hypothetical protein
MVVILLVLGAYLFLRSVEFRQRGWQIPVVGSEVLASLNSYWLVQLAGRVCIRRKHIYCVTCKRRTSDAGTEAMPENCAMSASS